MWECQLLQAQKKSGLFFFFFLSGLGRHPSLCSQNLSPFFLAPGCSCKRSSEARSRDGGGGHTGRDVEPGGFCGLPGCSMLLGPLHSVLFLPAPLDDGCRQAMIMEPTVGPECDSPPPSRPHIQCSSPPQDPTRTTALPNLRADVRGSLPSPRSGPPLCRCSCPTPGHTPFLHTE